MKYKSNMDAVLSKLKDMLNPDKLDALYLEIATNVHASNLRRIHNDGQDVNGRTIGHYSTKPFYMNPKRSPRGFAPQGKNGAKNRKTRYFSGGYKQFRSVIGRPNNKVDLQLSGGLLHDFQIKRIYGGYVIGFMTKHGSDIAKGMETKYRRKIWGWSSQDKTIANNIIKRHFKNAQR